MTRPKRPNILWITCEDMSVSLRCFGDPYAYTPHLDRLASEGVRFTRVFTHAPVCAPSRSGVITGMYPTSIGSHNMRCAAVPPLSVRCFTEYLREAGYYCTNNSKTDYNFSQHPGVHLAQDAPLSAWDDSSPQAHWRNRPPGVPFFSVFNILYTHESQLRSRDPQLLKQIEALPPEARHDPAKANLPPYYPDTPAVRRDWAQHYDTVTLMDMQAGEILRQLEEDGLAEDTIVWFWSDHGVGLPRAKRWVYDSGIHVPLIIRVPEAYRALALPDRPQRLEAGGVIDDLIAFVDFAPTMLSLAGIRPPRQMQGQAFLGRYRVPARQYVYAARDRMDETYDLIRAVRDKRFKYIRNFMPHLPNAQEIVYAEETPTLQEMRRLHAEGKLNEVQERFFQPSKPVEELYDTESDPHELHNLAGDPRYGHVLERMRRELYRWMEQTGDVGLIPEPELDEMMQPGGKKYQTSAPVIQATRDKRGLWKVSMRCVTPGASVVYRTVSDREQSSGWRLYVRPVPCLEGETLVAKACRLGCIDSEEVLYQVGSPLPEPPARGEQPPDWRENLRRSGVLKRLLELKRLDGRNDEEALNGYERALRNRHSAVRYWAVVGLQNACTDAGHRKRLLPVLKRLLGDPSDTVKIAAAQTLCLWGDPATARPVLQSLFKHRQEHVRLFAFTVLRSCEDLARQMIPHLREGLQDSSEDVRKVAQTVLEKLGEG